MIIRYLAFLLKFFTKNYLLILIFVLVASQINLPFKIPRPSLNKINAFLEGEKLKPLAGSQNRNLRADDISIDAEGVGVKYLNKFLTKVKLFNPAHSSLNGVKVFAQQMGIYDTLVNTFDKNTNADYPFELLVNNENFCKKNPGVYAISFYLTRVEDVARREQIRGSWGGRKWQEETGIYFIYVLGKSMDKNINDKVLQESNTHGDIIQADFLDNYQNLTFKPLTFLHWTTKFCPQVSWIIKSDFDVFVNPFLTSKYLRSFDAVLTVDVQRKNRIYCNPRTFLHEPERDSSSKYYISRKEYPLSIFPLNCKGPGYILPIGIVKPMYDAANKLSPFKMEDVYYTGILPLLTKSRINIENLRNLISYRPTEWSESLYLEKLLILEADVELKINNVFQKLWNHVLKSHQNNVY